MIEPDRPRRPEVPPTAAATAPRVRSSFHAKATYLLVLSAYLLHTWRFNFLCDDAFISFRYSRNLAHGLGLRFNPGESPPVEGFSNFLWVLLMSLFEWQDLPPAVWSRILSVSCGILLVVALLRYLHRRLGMPLGVVLAAGLFLALFPPVAVWSTGGLEAMPFTLLVFLAFERLTGDPGRPRPVAAGLAGLGVALMRTEGFAWAAAVGIVAATALVLRGRRELLVRTWPYWAIVLAGLGIFLAWRVWYFGDWWSNTAYAKAGLTGFALLRGWNYSVRFVLHYLSPGVILVASLGLLSRPRGEPAWPATLMVAATFAAAILVGGDFMPFARLFVVCVPFLTVLLACVLNRIWSEALPRRLATVALATACPILSMLVAFDFYLVPASVRESFRFRWAFFREKTDFVPLSEYRAWRRSGRNCRLWARTGRALKLVAGDHDSIVLGAIGATAYYSGLHVYDLGGLVDREVGRRPPASGRRSAGHDKAVPVAYFEKHDPTYLYAVLRRRTDALQEELPSLHALILDRPGEGDLPHRYQPKVIPLPPGQGFENDEVLVVGIRKSP